MEGGTRGRHRSERTPSSEKEETTGKELEFSLREERKKGREEIRVGDISFARPLGGSFFPFPRLLFAAAAARESPCRRRTAAAVQ